MNKSELLEQASFDGDLSMVKSLLQEGADINALGRNWNPLHAAIENMNVEIIKHLLDSGAYTEFVCLGATTLHHAIDIEIDAAIQMNAVELPEPVITQMLLDAGAKINGLDVGGQTPLQMAQSRGHKKAAGLLKSLGAI